MGLSYIVDTNAGIFKALAALQCNDDLIFCPCDCELDYAEGYLKSKLQSIRICRDVSRRVSFAYGTRGMLAPSLNSGVCKQIGFLSSAAVFVMPSSLSNLSKQEQSI